MLLKRLSLAVLLLTAFFAQDAFSQRRPANIFVGKCLGQPGCDAQYSTIMAALAAANSGEIIEIIDTEVYAEQINIRSDKSGITIRSTNPTNRSKPIIRWRDAVNTSPQNYNEARNIAPGTNCGIDGYEVGCSGNFSTNGTIRIIGAIGVTLDGLAIEGGETPALGRFPFGYDNVWEGAHAMFYGNSSVAIAGSGNITIRNCDLRNSYHGISVKDRNNGGIFQSSNPADNDRADQIPLASFGTQGGHLFEYNRIHNNAVGYSSESAWDLASTVRYNLFFNNHHLVPGTDPGNPGSNDDKTPGAIVFKDQVLSPVAIYNNTFYNNAGNISFKMWAAGPHLIFNNIFSSQAAGGRNGLMPRLTNRVHSSVVAASGFQSQNVHIQSPHHQCTPNNAQVPVITEATMPDGFPAPPSAPFTPTQVFQCRTPEGCNPDPVGNPGHTPYCTGNEPRTGTGQAINRSTHGATLGMGSNVNWVETGGYLGNPSLFQSVTPGDANFLHPVWDDPLVVQYIRNKGWPTAGILNSDGSMADLGAISSVAAPITIVARAIPTNVVRIAGAGANNATAEFRFEAYDAATGRTVTLENAEITLVRWVQPIPMTANKDFNPASAAAILSANIRDLTSQLTDRSVAMGANRKMFTVPDVGQSVDVGQLYGFFEFVIKGTYQGRTIISDVSFLPYTRLRNFFTVEVLHNGSPVDVVQAGVAYTLRIRAFTIPENATNPLSHNTGIESIEFQLFTNNMSSTMWVPPDPGAAFTVSTPGISSGQNERTWPVYFKTAGDESIRATGIGTIGGRRVAFLGVGDIKVRPGPPEKVTFIVPGPKSDLCPDGNCAPALPMPLGAPFNVEVGVTDKFNNLVDQSVPLKLDNIDQVQSAKDRSCLVADFTSQNASTDVATGIATFTINVGCGVQGEWFDMRAEVTSGDASGSHDIGRLRVGRTQDRLYIFVGGSSNSGDPLPGDWNPDRGNIAYWDPDAEVRGAAAERVAIHVKAVSGGAVMERDFEVCLTATDPEIEFYDAASGGNRLHDVSINLNNGEGVVWITALAEVDNASIEAFACGGSANAINSAFPRNNIYFRPLSSEIRNGVVTARGNGSGVPDTMMIYFAEQEVAADKFGGNWPMPESAYLYWPAEVVVTNPEVLGTRVESTTIEIADGEVGRQLRVVFPAGSGHPTGYTSLLGSEMIGGLKWTMGAPAGAPVEWERFRVVEEIGPIISARGNAFNDAPMGRTGPMIMENIGGERQDTIMIQISEGVANFGEALAGASILHRKGSGAAPTDYILDALPGDGASISVASVTPRGEWFYLALSGAGGDNNIEEGDYIRFSHTKGIADGDGNEVQGNNRWVRITLKPLPPEIDQDNSYYANVINTPVNLVDQIKVKFNKEVDPYGWFDELSVDFAGVLASNKISDMEAEAINSVTGDPSAIEINLAKAFPSVFGGNAAAIQNLTSGTMTLNIRYKKGEENPITNEWDPTHGVISDGATPVLVSHGNHKESNYVGAVLKVGAAREDGNFDLDTLVITYTERLNESFTTNHQPLVFHRNDGAYFTPVLEFLTQNTNAGGRGGAGWHQVRYLVPEGGFGYPDGSFVTIDDSVSINALEPYVTDLAGNSQMVVNNRKVPLRIENKVSWGLRIRNNPFKAGKGGRDFTTVVFTPMVKGATDLEATVKVMLYDNLGSLVRTDEFNLKDHGYENDKGAPCIDWKWNGRNKRGRFVGTGTYHLKAVLDMKSGAIDGGRDRTTEVRAIGFVR